MDLLFIIQRSNKTFHKYVIKRKITVFYNLYIYADYENKSFNFIYTLE